MYSVIIVGAGSIGSLKDVETKEGKVITHAHAVVNHEELELVGIVDQDYEKAIEAANKWNTKPYQNLSDINKKVDIFVIASSTLSHFLILNEISYLFDPLLVICEKPFCDTYAVSQKAHKIFFNNLIPITVNYTRRFSKEIQLLRNDLFIGNFGEIYSCVANYNRGLFRDGCHFLDLCNWFFGKFKDGKILGDDSVWINDLSEEDPTVPVWMSYEKCPNIFMVPVDGRKAACFEMEIITEEGKIVLDDWFQGFKFYPVKQEDTYGNYSSLSGKVLKTGTILLTNCLSGLYDNVVNSLNDNEELKCTAEDGVEVHKIIEYLRSKR